MDIGSNSTRLLIADVDPASGAVEEVLRRSEVTRLGEGLDASGSLRVETQPGAGSTFIVELPGVKA